MQKKILVVDDDPDMRDLFSTILEKDGHEVVTARDGVEGYEIARQERPDLIVLDIMMGTQDEGFQLAYSCRSDPVLCDIPLIVASSIAEVSGFDFDTAKDGDFLPADAFLRKPVEPSGLLDSVRSCLGH